MRPVSPSSRALGFALCLVLAACGDGGKQKGESDASIGGDGSGDGSDGPPVACRKDADCDDENACTGKETCSDGFCVAGEQKTCDDGIACTKDFCDPVDGACSHRPPDADSDGVADAKCLDAEGSPLGTDCDDDDAERFPGNDEVCRLDDDSKTRDEDCNPETFGTLDNDKDGFVNAACVNVGEGDQSFAGSDCDDNIANVNPNAPEVCDLVDNDCDGREDEALRTTGLFDEDGDGYGNELDAVEALDAAGKAEFVGTYRELFSVIVDPETGKIEACPGNLYLTKLTTDCDDTPGGDSLYVHENAVELCDGLDNDCDDAVDENVVQVPWYPDLDGDGFGDANADPALIVITCQRLEGYSLLATDCNDTDSSINPRAAEQCDGVDNNCDGKLNFLIGPGNTEDDDKDGAADALCGTLRPDCDDQNASVRPGAPELCDGLDNDCNGVADTQTKTVAWYVDLDKDGFGDPNVAPVVSCEVVPNRVTRAGDCDDEDNKRNPNAKDDCTGKSGVDDDCDESIDEGEITSAFFKDDDADGYGAGQPLFACAMPVGYVASAGDCDDDEDAQSPGESETCDPDQGIDDDCDGNIDCLDTECTNDAECQALVRIRVKTPSEPITAVLAQPFNVTVEALTPQNTPVASLELTLSCDSATRGLWASPVQNQPTKALTDASGLATFAFTPGQAVDSYTCTVSAGAALPKQVVVQGIAPQDGTLFSAVNASKVANYLTTPGSAIGSPIYSPSDVVIASDGTAYVSSYYSYRIARITKRGALDFVAGTGSYGNDGDGGLAKDAKIGYVERLALDETRNRLYLADQSGARVRMVNLTTGRIYAYAGGGSDTTFNGGSALTAQFDVAGMDVGADGSLYVLAVTHGLLRIGLQGTITRLVAQPSGCTAGVVSFYGCASATYCDLTRSKDGSIFMVGTTCDGSTTRFGLMRYDPVTNETSVMPGGTATTGDGQSVGLTDLSYSYGIARDAEGNVYLAQQHRIRRIDQNTRLVSTLLGSTTAGGAGDYGPYASATINDPRGLAFDPEGGLWIAEQGGHTIRRIWREPKARLTSVALAVTGGDGQKALPFELMDPLFVTATANGQPAASMTLEVEPGDPSFTAAEMTTNFEGTGIVSPRSGYLIDQHVGDVVAYDLDGHVIASDSFGWETVTPPAQTITSVVNPARTAAVSIDGASGGVCPAYYPMGAAAAADGTIFYSDYNGRIFALSPDGFVSWLAGGGTGDDIQFGTVAARTANLGYVQALAYYEAGKQLYALNNTRLYRIDLESETATAVMGLGEATLGGSLALETKLSSAYSVVVSATGIVYVSDLEGVRSFDGKLASPTTTQVYDLAANCSGQAAGTLYGNTSSQALGLASDGTLYFTASECPSGYQVLVRIDGVNQHTRLTAVNGSSFVGPLPASSAQVSYVRGNMAVDADGNLYFAETSNYRVRRLTPALQIEPVAGTGTSGNGGDFGPAKDAQLYGSYSGLAVLPNGDLIIADYYNQNVRRIWNP